MTKRLFAVLPLLCVLTFAMAAQAAAPTTAVTTTPSVTAPTPPATCSPAMSAPEGDRFGSCRWYCGSKSYSTAAQCAANCRVECEEIC